ncbi:MAG: holo-ACP synthase [Clostridia bacterium]
MRIYCGTDIVEIHRIKKALDETAGFREKIYTENEIKYCEEKKSQRYKSYAARFSAKEAVAKALGTGFDKDIQPFDIEILNDEKNKPFVRLHGKISEEFIKREITRTDLSLSHCDTYAVAYFVALGEG